MRSEGVVFEEIDVIELKLPFKAEYVSMARLTVSGIASRMGFDIDTIEDIKVAAAEVCNKLVERGSKTASNYFIVYEVRGDSLKISFGCEDRTLRCIFDDEEDELGLSIITALMDEVELCSDGAFMLSMSKLVEESSW
jgi:serine/threonine-protein kinase RsbW